MINWQLWDSDGERRWEGFLKGQSRSEYIVMRGGYCCSSDLDFGDSCEDELDGINCCEAHHKYGDSWPKKIHSDPILSDHG